MKFLIIMGSPKKSGLCSSVAEEIRRGAEDGGADVRVIEPAGLERCKMCGEGWGICKGEHRCAFGGDGFDEVQEAVREAELICLVTPVYWWEMSEGLKTLTDKLRRCEFGQTGALSGKPVLLVASPGGSGNGMVECLDQMTRFCRHVNASVFDCIGVNRWNSDYKAAAAYAAARAMASGRKPGDTV